MSKAQPQVSIGIRLHCREGFQKFTWTLALLSDIQKKCMYHLNMFIKTII